MSLIKKYLLKRLKECNCDICDHMSDFTNNYYCLYCNQLIIDDDEKEYNECDCSLKPRIKENRAKLAFEVLEYYKECLTEEKPDPDSDPEYYYNAILFE